MRREEQDLGELVSDADELAEEIRLYEAYQERQAAWAELQRGDLRAIQQRIARLVPGATLVPVGTGRIRHNEVDK